MKKKDLEKKGFVPSYSLQFITEGRQGRDSKQDRNLEAGTESSRGHGGVLLTGMLSWLAQPPFLYSPGLAAKDASTQWPVPHTPNHQSRHCPTDLLQVNLIKALSQLTGLE